MANDAAGNGALNLAPSGSFDLFDDPPRNNIWWNNNKGTINLPLVVSGVTFDSAGVKVGGSLNATFSGQNLTPQTYFDMRVRRPGASNDEVVNNWQQGISTSHAVTAGVPAGTWNLTGIRAHDDIDDHTGEFTPISATVMVSP